MFLQLLGKSSVDSIGFTDKERPGGVFVDTMDDSRTKYPVDAGQIALAVIQDGIDQSSGSVSGTWMDYHALGFVDDEKVVILIQNIKRNILRKDIRFLYIRKVHRYALSCLYFVICLYGLSPGQYLAIF
jgi:hypothetical protein